MLENILLDALIDRAIDEDYGTGDITTLCTVPEDRTVSGRFLAKEAGVVCGLHVTQRVFQKLDAAIRFTALVRDGDAVQKGTVLATIEGNARAVLVGERTALNFLQRMSGIATRTAEAVRAAEGTNARITDTRKTTPGLRVLEKYAVRMGGGSNHRFNLSDGVLIKDNHIAAAGGITAAVQAARRSAPHTLKVEVEVEDFDMLDEALSVGADIIMLDNMTLPQMAEAVRRVGGRAVVEASGNMGGKDLRQVAETGVNLISIGALTHTVRAMDISLKFDKI